MLQQTRTIPIIFVIVADPACVAARPRQVLDESAPNPIGRSGRIERAQVNITVRRSFGIKYDCSPLDVGRNLLEQLHQFAGNRRLHDGKAGLEALAVPVNDETELETVIAAHARGMNGRLVVMPDGFLNVHRAEIVSLTARYRPPAAYPWRFFAELGGLLSYGREQDDEFRLAASYVDRILKG